MADIYDFYTGRKVSTFEIPADMTEEEQDTMVENIIRAIYGDDYDEDDEV